MACIFNVTGGVLAPEEKIAYLDRAVELYGREPDSIDVRLDGEFVDLAYHYKTQPFTASAASPAIWWVRSIASTTPSAPRNTIASSIRYPCNACAK